MPANKNTPPRPACAHLRGARKTTRTRSTRRRVTIAVAALAAVLAGGTLSFALTPHSATSNTTGTLTVPAHATGPDGTVITYGAADAPETVHVYEDPRCPFCKKFETALGPTLTQLADSGTVKVEFHMAAFLDKALGGKGSTTALAALGAALNESPAKFKQFHDALYHNQPEQETTDAFAFTDTLLRIADQVPGLRTPTFDHAVQAGTYLPWAKTTADVFTESGIQGTPTVKAGSTVIDVIGPDGNAISTADFTSQIHTTTHQP